MSKPRCLVFLLIGVLLMLSLLVDAQPTVDDSDGSCDFPAFDETAKDVKLIREDLAEVKNMKEDLTEVKKIARGVEEVKNLLGSHQKSCSTLDSSILCEYSMVNHSVVTIFLIPKNIYI